MGVSTEVLQVPGVLYRQAVMTAKPEAESREIELSFSSEEAVDMGWGREVLSHDPQAVRLDRINKSGPLLFNHDRGAHLGRVLSASLDGKRGVARIKFSNSPEAQAKLQDVREGILQEVSVGYRVHKYREERGGNGETTYRATDWEPLEISLVTVPADTSVGVGRGGTKDPVNVPLEIIQQRNITMSEQNKNEPTAEEKQRKEKELAEQAQKRGVEFERKRQADIRSAEALCAKRGLVIPEGAHAKADSEGWNGDQFIRHVFNSQPEKPARVDHEVLDNMQRGEKKQFSLMRAMQSWMRTGAIDGFEAEVIAEVTKETGQRAESGGLLIPFSVLSQRSMLAGVYSQGGSTVPMDTGDFIPKLDPVAVVEQAGATVLRGLTAPTNFPRHTTAAVAQWVAEAEEIEKSTPGTDDVIVTPHGIGAYVEISRQLVLTPSIDVEAFVRGEIMRRLNLGIDKAALTGPGVTGIPRGVFELNTSTSGINTVTFGGAPTWEKVLEFEGAIEDADALMGSLAWITSAPVKSVWKGTSKDAGSGLFLATESNTANGYNILTTSQLAGTAHANKVVFGNFSDLLVGMYGAIEILIDQSAALQRRGLIGITGLAHADVAFRHPESFAVSTDTGNQ